MTFLSGTISTQHDGEKSDIMDVGANETTITLDVLPDSDETKSHLTLLHSPDKLNWFKSDQVTNGSKSITITVATAHVRVCVIVGEGSGKTAKWFITAK